MDRALEKKKWTGPKIGSLIGIPVLFTLMLFAFFATKGKSKLNIDGERLTIEKVKKAGFQELIPVMGTVQPVSTVHLDAVVGGTVEELFTEDGKILKKGDPIMRLSNMQLQMDYINREAQLLDEQNNIRTTLLNLEQKSVTQKQELLELELELMQAKRTFEQNTALNNEKVIATAEYDKSREQFEFLTEKRKLILQNIKSDSLFRNGQEDQMKASLQLIQTNLAFLQNSLGNLVIKAPISGQVSSLEAELGETEPQGKNIAQIDVMNDFKVRAKVGEHYISRVNTGLKGRFTMDGKEYELNVSKIFPEVSNGEFEIDMKFEGEKPAGIKRGQNLQVKLALGDETRALILPKGGFYQSTGGNWVYAMDNGVARRRNIHIGRQNPDYYEVTDGLDSGDEVITSGYEAFNDADELVIKNKSK